MICLSANMYRQISRCTDKTPKKHYWGGGGGSCPPCPPSGYASADYWLLRALRELRDVKFRYSITPLMQITQYNINSLTGSHVTSSIAHKCLICIILCTLIFYSPPLWPTSNSAHILKLHVLEFKTSPCWWLRRFCGEKIHFSSLIKLMYQCIELCCDIHLILWSQIRGNLPGAIATNFHNVIRRSTFYPNITWIFNRRASRT